MELSPNRPGFHVTCTKIPRESQLRRNVVLGMMGAIGRPWTCHFYVRRRDSVSSLEAYCSMSERGFVCGIERLQQERRWNAGTDSVFERQSIHGRG